MTWRHHGARVVGKADPPRRTATRDSGEIISVYAESGGPRRTSLADPPEITMPEPGNVLEYLAPSTPPLGQSGEATALGAEKYWMQANGLPQAERERRANIERQRYYDAVWAKRHPYAQYGGRARDEGILWRTTVKMGEPDGLGIRYGMGENGANYRQLPDGTVEMEEKEDVPLQPIGDRRSVSSRDRESAGLKAMNARYAAFWSRPYR
jgi:hypothetical protein